jgi:hypothetical protein
MTGLHQSNFYLGRPCWSRCRDRRADPQRISRREGSRANDVTLRDAKIKLLLLRRALWLP